MNNWYRKHERHLSSWALLFGFVFDSLTLQRVDSFGDNLWLCTNLLFAATLVMVVNKQANPKPWLLDILQFAFGNLLGGFFIFYFRSASLAASWPFLLLLLGAILANELFQKRYARLAFQVSFLYLIIYAFVIYLVPILTHRLGPAIFLLSGAVGLALIALFVALLRRVLGTKFEGSRTWITRSVSAIFIVMNFLYFTNLIPPIPLSLKDAGVYHDLSRDSRGRYLVEREKKGFLDYLHLHQQIHIVTGESLYAYSAVFSPTDLDTRIVHEWQYKDESGEWVTESRISLGVSGGRGEGFRTYSTKAALLPGLWRVNVATPQGQLLGRTTFRLIHSDTRTPIEIEVKE